jgi:serine/threonine-protein kinase
VAPSRLGRYEILKLLGQGGMGAVYKASDPLLDRVVALKTINPGLLAGEERDEYLERFRREARAAGRLSHPNIVSVFDLGFDEPTATSFIVMEYVPGVSLETVLVENPALPLDQAIEIVEQVGAALEEAHRHGIVHRDIKPANVFLDERGRVKVGDFGVARLAGSELTQSGIGIGTPGYAAPEVLRGGVADARSDVFALGVLAYRVLTGRRPFDGVTREMLGMEILEREPSPPRAVRAEIPEPLSTAVMRALVKSPEARTPSAQEFLREWRSPVTVPMPTRTVRPERAGSRSRRWILLAATVTAILALGTGAVLAVRALRETATPQEAAAPVAPRRSPAPAPTPRPAAGAGDTSDPAAKAAEELLREGRKRAEEWAREQLKQEEEKKQQGKKDKGRGRDKKKN